MALEYLKRLAELTNQGRHEEAVAVSAEAAQRHPDDDRVLRARAIVLRRANRGAEAERFLVGVLEARSRAWAHAQLGLALQGRELLRAIDHLRQAHQLEPHAPDYRMALVFALARTHDGEALDEAYGLLKPVLHEARNWTPSNLHIAYDVLSSVCAYDERDQLGTPAELGRKWAAAGSHTSLLMLLSSVAVPDAPDVLIEGGPGEDVLT